MVSDTTGQVYLRVVYSRVDVGGLSAVRSVRRSSFDQRREFQQIGYDFLFSSSQRRQLHIVLFSDRRNFRPIPSQEGHMGIRHALDGILISPELRELVLKPGNVRVQGACPSDDTQGKQAARPVWIWHLDRERARTPRHLQRWHKKFQQAI